MTSVKTGIRGPGMSDDPVEEDVRHKAVAEFAQIAPVFRLDVEQNSRAFHLVCSPIGLYGYREAAVITRGNLVLVII